VSIAASAFLWPPQDLSVSDSSGFADASYDIINLRSDDFTVGERRHIDAHLFIGIYMTP
jgi:hypothetical protein